jgi:hypothetical protein
MSVAKASGAIVKRIRRVTGALMFPFQSAFTAGYSLTKGPAARNLLFFYSFAGGSALGPMLYLSLNT